LEDTEIKILAINVVDRRIFVELLGIRDETFYYLWVIIHIMGDSQDIRFMGSLSFQMPLTSVCLCVSNFALRGIPFLAGFYSIS
jgi:NADH:ubiquinone oxidoreductase subunit 2 (subunit N)